MYAPTNLIFNETDKAHVSALLLPAECYTSFASAMQAREKKITQYKAAEVEGMANCAFMPFADGPTAQYLYWAGRRSRVAGFN